MAIRINSNITSMRANTDFTQTERDSFKRRARLASGLAISSGRDGAARLSISEGMRAEIGGLTEGTRNAEHASDLLRTAEGAIGQVSSILIRMRELAVESSSSTLNDDNRESLDAEFNQLKEYIDRIAKLETYNNESLLSGFGNQVNASTSSALTDSVTTGTKSIKLSGAAAGTYTFIDDGADNALTLGNGVATQTVDFGAMTVGDQVATGTTLVVNFDSLGLYVKLAGADVEGMAGSYTDGNLDGHTLVIEEGTGGSFQLGSDAVPADRLEYDIEDMVVSGAAISLSQVSIGTQDGARHSLAMIDQAIQNTTKERGTIGALLNRLQYTIDFTANSLERVNASESTVRDADFASESSHLARNQIISQASTAVMIQSRLPVEMIMGLLQ